MRDVLAVLAAFLCGSIPFGLLLVRLTHGIDVRDVGSGNIGATNAARAAGRKIGVLVLALDLLKGLGGVLLARAIAGADPAPAAAGLFLFGPVAGHVFTPWLRFKGGKGVATALGMLLAADPRLFAVGAIVFLLVCAPTRMVSAGSLAGTLAVAVVAVAWPGPLVPAESWGIVGAALLIVWRHKDNIRRIATGTESRVGQKKPATNP